MGDYRYLFPFEKIDKGASVIIYGAGILGQEYVKQIEITNYCRVVALIDKNASRYQFSRIPVFYPEKLRELDFDYAIVAIRVETAYKEIRRILCEVGVPEDRIVCIYERIEKQLELFDGMGEQKENELRCRYVYMNQNENISIAFFSSGGIGDMITHKKFITEVISRAGKCDVDLYTARECEFIRFLYSDNLKVINVIDDAGIIYGSNKEKYDLSITVNAMQFIRVDHYSRGLLCQKNEDFCEMIEKLDGAVKEENFDISTPFYLPYYQRIYRGENCYSYFSYKGILKIDGKKVNIPLENTDIACLKKYELEEPYITFNSGNGDAASTCGISKAWPVQYFEETIKLIKKHFPCIKIIQLGAEKAIHIAGADYYILGEKLETVCLILSKARLHFDIEGGLVHIASQIGISCVVLLGPTQQEYVGYRNNINISAGTCHGCYGLYPDNNKCARGMTEPQCMYSIKPQMVFEKISESLKKTEGDTSIG